MSWTLDDRSSEHGTYCPAGFHRMKCKAGYGQMLYIGVQVLRSLGGFCLMSLKTVPLILICSCTTIQTNQLKRRQNDCVALNTTILSRILPSACESDITCKCHHHLPSARSGGQDTQAWFCAAQQGGSGKENRSRCVPREEWHHCLRSAAECRVVLTFRIWLNIRPAGTRGLAAAWTRRDSSTKTGNILITGKTKDNEIILLSAL